VNKTIANQMHHSCGFEYVSMWTMRYCDPRVICTSILWEPNYVVHKICSVLTLYKRRMMA